MILPKNIELMACRTTVEQEGLGVLTRGSYSATGAPWGVSPVLHRYPVGHALDWFSAQTACAACTDSSMMGMLNGIFFK